MFKGTNASAGIGIGKAAIIKENELVIRPEKVIDGAAEVERFKGALAETIAQTETLAADLATRVGEKEAEIMQGHLMLLNDPMLTNEIESAITGDNVCSEFAIETVCTMYADMFASMDDELMQQRATDMRDIKVRLQQVLQGVKPVDIAALPEGSVIVAKDLTPSMTAGINPANVAGIVTEMGGRTSHSAILARALEIPAVVAVPGILGQVEDGAEMIVDGSEGVVLAAPSEEEKAEYTAKRDQFLKEKKELEQYIGKPTVTRDGVEIELVANIGNPDDVEKVLQYDGEGVGLFRTEFLFIGNSEPPTVEEQTRAYTELLSQFPGKKVVIRMLDAGADKPLPFLTPEDEPNPALGLRGLRTLRAHMDVLEGQLKALAAADAATDANLWVMAPMVADQHEADYFVKLGKSFGLKFVGAMAEVPSIALMADKVADVADFVSIGTNDLTQYTLAIDRQNPKLDAFYDPHHPAVLRMIQMVVDNAHKAGIWAGICGELGADQTLTRRFLAMGVDELSMSPGSILPVRKIILETDVTKERENNNLC